MPKPKGPHKKSIHVRVLDSTWQSIERKAKAKGLAVPTYVTQAIENKFGEPHNEQS